MGDAVKNGIGYVPESRLTEGLVLTKSASDNITITYLDKLKNKAGLISLKKKDKSCSKNG